MYYAPKTGLGWIELIPSILGIGISAIAGNAQKKEDERTAKLKAALQKEQGFQEARANALLQTQAAQEQVNAALVKKSMETKIMLGAVAGVAAIVAGVFIVSAVRRRSKK